MSQPKISAPTTEAPMTRVPANPLLPPSARAAWALPGQAMDPSHCPVDHEARGLAPDYLRATPTDVTHLLDGTLNYEGFFRRQLHDLHMAGNYRVFCDLERRAGDFPRATITVIAAVPL